MTELVQVRLVGGSREDLAGAVAALERGLGKVNVRITIGKRPGRQGDWLAYGTLLPFDTPETVAAKTDAAMSVAHRALDAWAGLLEG